VALPWPGPTPTLPTSVNNNGSVSNHSPKTTICNNVSCGFSGAPLPPLPPNKKGSVDTDSGINPTKDSGSDIKSQEDSSTNINSKKDNGAGTNSKKDSSADTSSKKDTNSKKDSSADTNSKKDIGANNSKKDSGADTNSKKDIGTNVGSDSFRDTGNRSTSESTGSESFGSVLSSPLTSVLSSPLNSVLFSPITDSWRKTTSTRFGANHDSIKEGAWGIVVVTASMAGDIRVYHNFGLPVRLNRSIQLV
jgi:hypothetical protein